MHPQLLSASTEHDAAPSWAAPALCRALPWAVFVPGLGTSLAEAFSELPYSVMLPAPILSSLCLWVSDLRRGLKVPQLSLSLLYPS